MNFCTNCGAPVIQGNRFCVECGTPVRAARPEASTAPAEQPAAKRPDEQSTTPLHTPNAQVTETAPGAARPETSGTVQGGTGDLAGLRQLPRVEPPTGRPVVRRNWPRLAVACLLMMVLVGAATYAGIRIIDNRRAPDGEATADPGQQAPPPGEAGTDAPDGASACTEPAGMTPTDAVRDGELIGVEVELTSSCGGAATLAAPSATVTVTSSAGEYAAGIFDFSSTTLRTSGAEPGTATLLFPADSSFTTTSELDAAIQNGGVTVEVTSNSGAAPPSAPAGASTTGVEVSADRSPYGDRELQSKARQALHRIAAADEPVTERLVGEWLPQLSSKYEGLLWRGITYDATTILQTHRDLAARHVPTVLVNSSDWEFLERDMWVSLLAKPQGTEAVAERWCARHGYTIVECDAKQLRRR